MVEDGKWWVIGGEFSEPQRLSTARCNRGPFEF